MEQKQPKKRHCKYDAEFKKEVLKMIQLGRSVPDISQSLGIGSNLIYAWAKRSRSSTSDTAPTSSALTLDEEKLAMHKRIKELEMERDILKKALGHFQPSDISELYAFIASNEGQYPCQLQCRVLEVSRSAYYTWRCSGTHTQDKEHKQMEQQIIDTFREHKHRYGSRRISKAMKAKGKKVSVPGGLIWQYG